MSNHINPNDILHRILNGTSTDADIEDLRQWFESGGIENFQAGKYNVNIEQGQDIHIGDRIYQGFEAETIKEVFDSALKDREVYIARKSNRKNIINPDRMPSLKTQTINKSVKPQRRPKKSNLEKTIQISNNTAVLYNLRSTDKAKTNALKILGRVANGNDHAIRWIIVLIGRERNNTTIAEAIETLSKIGKDKPSVITAMSRLLTPDLNSLAIIDAMRSIIKRIASNNETLIQKMLNLLAKSDLKIKTSIIITMGEVEIGTRIAIDRLLSELESKKNSLTLRKEVAKSLGKVARGDKKAVIEMERIARFEGNKYLKDCIIANSKKINI
jgi:Effector-associated domain 10